MKTWIKFLKEWFQKEDKAKNIVSKSFSVGTVIEVDADLAKALVTAGLAEITEAPVVGGDIDAAFKGLEQTIASIVEKTLPKAIADVTKGLDSKVEKIFANPKNHEEEAMRGFKSAKHFFGEVMKAGANFDNPGEELLVKLPSGQNVSNDSEGGFLVPEPIADGIWTNMMGNPASVMPLTARYETAGSTMKIPRIFESSRKAGKGQRFGGIQTTWLDEAAEIQATKVTTGRLSMEVHKLGAVVYLTQEMIDDGGNSLPSFLNRNVPEAIRFAVEEAFFDGSGVGKPKGIYRGDSVIKVPLQAGQGNHTIFHRNLSNMYWKNSNRSNANWYMHPDAAQQLEFVYFDDDTTNKRPIYLPSNITGLPFAMLYGRPVIPCEFCKDFGAVGDILFADWSQYATLTKVGGGVKTATSMHVRFLYEETAIRFTFRIDGRELWTSPREDLNGDTSRSPFITLASRTGGNSSSGI